MQRARHVLVVLALLLLALLGCNRGLWTPDEPREAEISREMMLTPAVIPTLNGQRFIEKPPLYYWVVAAVYRLGGGPSALAARAVSVVAGLATLAVLFFWGSSAYSRGAGVLAALMLASSVQFLVSTHWVLIDPVLMLTTTIAAWAAWLLLARRDSGWLLLLFYVCLVLALWIKGLVGPVLVVAGLLGYLAVDRPLHWRRLRPLMGMALLTAAVALLAFAIFRQGGRAALWEWAYVNHVKRLLSPGITGHRQPLPYYLWTLPYAVLPWLLPLIESLRPARWRRTSNSGVHSAPDPARYGALMSAAMLVLLSLSATKRETYLLPVLPLLFLWLAIRSYEWWQRWQLSNERQLGAWWWLQLLLLCVWCLSAPAAALLWTGQLGGLVLTTLLAGLLTVVALLYLSVTRQRRRAGICAVVTAYVGAALLMLLAPPLLNATKDMGPFMRAVGRQLPAQQPLFASGVDETLSAEIPFYTGRQVIALAMPPRAPMPTWVLVQDNHDGKPAILPPDYQLQFSQSFGSRRTLALWRRQMPPSAAASVQPQAATPP